MTTREKLPQNSHLLWVGTLSATMAQARFSIGIDLGTTNCALAFVPLDGEAKSEILAVPQWATLSTIAESTVLPSFLYLPEEAAATQIGVGEADKAQWIVGMLARQKAAESPGRVVHSAKSWLCHHTADRSARFLPWESEDIDGDSGVSPVSASALILSHLKQAWNRQFAGAGGDFEFDRQQITVTVPASFDAAAQRLVLMAAREAGFPESVRLLEEPQAAFYCWLEQHDFAGQLAERLGNGSDQTHLLVVDIGGGTSDFSLFELRSPTGGSAPRIKRAAVGDHILLGGDNIDLAIAHLLEPRLTGERGQKLSGTEWADLIARCRDLKESLLTGDRRPDEAHALALPGRGSGLVASSRTAQLTRAELEALVLDGFFPECPAQAHPHRAQSALKEWGLSYASDGAVTRHLAQFLWGRPRVDAILFNGGSLRPELMRERICAQIAKWQGGLAPLALENAHPELAVARGAALFGKILHHGTQLIEAGAARAVFLEVLRKGTSDSTEQPRPALVCVLPHGASPEQRFEITGLPLELQLDRLARFQAYYSARDDSSKAGDVADRNADDLHALPPLETVIKVTQSAGGTTADTLSVKLVASVNELGLLQVSCVSADPSTSQSWPLEFNLRPHEQDGRAASRIPAGSNASVAAKPNATGQALQAARARIRDAFNPPLKRREPLTAPRLLRSLEQTFAMPKSKWNAALVRSLWPALESCIDRRRESVDHEEAWLSLAGFLLRPGFGADADHFRIDSLWRLHEQGLCFAGKRTKAQEYLLWRRVAGGLARQRQEQILAPELGKICAQQKVAPELIQLTGSLERLPIAIKTELANLFIDAASDLARNNKHCAHYLGALSHILSRAPLYAGPETVVSPDLVERAYGTFRSLDWRKPELAEMQTLFLRAVRVVGSRNSDLPKAVRHRIANQLESAGVSPQKTGKLKEFVPVGGSERAGSYDESLPPGLILTESW
jgi:molecular chaperone DnaK (HSP70)